MDLISSTDVNKQTNKTKTSLGRAVRICYVKAGKAEVGRNLGLWGDNQPRLLSGLRPQAQTHKT